jgi:hypothetical protein
MRASAVQTTPGPIPLVFERTLTKDYDTLLAVDLVNRQC